MKATGHIREKRGILQMVTGLPAKGNKRKAQQMLTERLDELTQQYTVALENRKVLFLDFMRNWLDDVMAYKVKENTLEQ